MHREATFILVLIPKAIGTKDFEYVITIYNYLANRSPAYESDKFY